MSKVKVTVLVGALGSAFFSAHAMDIVPWPAYKSNQSLDRIVVVEKKILKNEMHDLNWDLINLEKHIREQGYAIENAPETLREIHKNMKEQIESIKQELEKT